MPEHPPELVEKVAHAIWADALPWMPWERANEADRQTHEGHARAALDAITETHAVVELPEPTVEECWYIPSCGEFNGIESTGDSVISVAITDDGIEADTFGEMTPLEATLFAAALLAAAREAERGTEAPG
jgi:hypothetical protein